MKQSDHTHANIISLTCVVLMPEELMALVWIGYITHFSYPYSELLGWNCVSISYSISMPYLFLRRQFFIARPMAQGTRQLCEFAIMFCSDSHEPYNSGLGMQPFTLSQGGEDMIEFLINSKGSIHLFILQLSTRSS